MFYFASHFICSSTVLLGVAIHFVSFSHDLALAMPFSLPMNVYFFIHYSHFKILLLTSTVYLFPFPSNIKLFIFFSVTHSLTSFSFFSKSQLIISGAHSESVTTLSYLI